VRGEVRTSAGVRPILADTICIHGDRADAPVFARRLRESLERAGVAVVAANARGSA
jgi:UPF0271 protein